ncbi:tetratricopeptide repeat protein [Desulforhopalus sp. IMCC35007]|uniref:tetratricopeptide repeat protein n=1 Tax=Desulforhopalus sp. IMCC35007 TaxID=2569543 RepID=UPI00145DBC77|nr:tetratricopeptide repeat protein [Desulforhopalus sp. IMCC35007]
MKKTVLKIGLLLSMAPLLVSCASQQDVEELRYQLRIVNKKVDDMKSDTVDRLQKRQAAASGQMDILEQDIMQLKSQLEESYHLNQRLREQNKELGETITSVAQNEASQREEALKKIEEQQREKEEKLTQLLNEKIRQQEENVKAIQQARIKEAERRAKEAAISAELAKNRSNSANSNLSGTQQLKVDKAKIKHSVVAPPTVPDTAIQPASSPSVAPVTTSAVTPSAPKEVVAPAIASNSSGGTGSFAEATKLYEQKKYSQALQIFEDIASNSNAAEQVDARYMMGECLFDQKEYDKAIMQYQKIIAQNSNHNKAPAAMLKQAMAFEKLADKDTAKVIYKKVLKKHSNSSEAAIAQTRLEKL